MRKKYQVWFDIGKGRRKKQRENDRVHEEESSVTLYPMGKQG